MCLFHNWENATVSCTVDFGFPIAEMFLETLCLHIFGKFCSQFSSIRRDIWEFQFAASGYWVTCHCFYHLFRFKFQIDITLKQIADSEKTAGPGILVNLTSLVKDGSPDDDISDCIRITVRWWPSIFEITITIFFNRSRNSDRTTSVRCSIREISYTWSLKGTSKSAKIITATLWIISLKGVD